MRVDIRYYPTIGFSEGRELLTTLLLLAAGRLHGEDLLEKQRRAMIKRRTTRGRIWSGYIKVCDGPGTPPILTKAGEVKRELEACLQRQFPN